MKKLLLLALGTLSTAGSMRPSFDWRNTLSKTTNTLIRICDTATQPSSTLQNHFKGSTIVMPLISGIALATYASPVILKATSNETCSTKRKIIQTALLLPTLIASIKLARTTLTQPIVTRPVAHPTVHLAGKATALPVATYPVAPAGKP